MTTQHVLPTTVSIAITMRASVRIQSQRMAVPKRVTAMAILQLVSYTAWMEVAVVSIRESNNSWVR
ncbi:hypothetical protein KP79_PYT22427 [Mizuhopecten yessoensis]|uniref:Uncharacterized protein n=1 Tax=Mizuhopecten yessoensis TaxID=6573 RepID=A0A210QP16_MIZYE|nr:hypothetical protein KP79_PYT22427 [Mizuhopecten yessoensis]